MNEETLWAALLVGFSDLLIGFTLLGWPILALSAFFGAGAAAAQLLYAFYTREE